MVLSQDSRNAEKAPRVFALPTFGLRQAIGSFCNSLAVMRLTAAVDMPKLVTKGCGTQLNGYPNAAYLKAVHPKFANVVTEKMPGRLIAPGNMAGEFTSGMAKRLGLQAGTPSERGDHRCAAGGTRCWSRIAWNIGNGHGDQFLSYAQRHRREAR